MDIKTELTPRERLLVIALGGLVLLVLVLLMLIVSLQVQVQALLPTATLTPSATPSITATFTPTATPSVTATPSATATPTPTPTILPGICEAVLTINGFSYYADWPPIGRPQFSNLRADTRIGLLGRTLDNRYLQFYVIGQSPNERYIVDLSATPRLITLRGCALADVTIALPVTPTPLPP